MGIVLNILAIGMALVAATAAIRSTYRKITEAKGIKQKVLGFLKDYIEWVESGAYESAYGGPFTGSPFKRCRGLCFTLTSYAIDKEWDHIATGRFLQQLFKDDGLSTAYPFGGSYRFAYDQVHESMHENPERIRWVRNTIKRLEGQV